VRACTRARARACVYVCVNKIFLNDFMPTYYAIKTITDVIDVFSCKLLISFWAKSLYILFSYFKKCCKNLTKNEFWSNFFDLKTWTERIWIERIWTECICLFIKFFNIFTNFLTFLINYLIGKMLMRPCLIVIPKLASERSERATITCQVPVVWNFYSRSFMSKIIKCK